MRRSLDFSRNCLFCGSQNPVNVWPWSSTDNFIVYIKTDIIYEDIAEDVESRFDNSNYELDRPLPKGKK